MQSDPRWTVSLFAATMLAQLLCGQHARTQLPGAPPPRHANLLKLAARVPMSEWERAYYWLSEHELLLLRNDPGRRRRTLMRRDIRTGAEKRLLALTRLYNRARPFPWPLGVSPDGKWFMWLSDEDRRVSLARLDGSGCVHWKVRNTWDPICWTEDSSAVVSMDFDGTWRYTATRHSVKDAESVAAFPLDVDERVHLAQADDIRVGFGDRLLVVKRYHGEKAAANVHVWVTTTWEAPPKAQEYVLPMPGDAREVELAVSLDGSRIAWLLSFDNEPYRQGLWVWSLGGGPMREIGSVPWSGHDDDPALGFVAWLPGGRRLSFAHGRALYTVPVR